MNQDNRVLFYPSDFNQSDPGGEDSNGQGSRIHNRNRLGKKSDNFLIHDNGVDEFLVRVTEHLLSINTSDKGGERSIVLEVNKTERVDGNLDFVGSRERGVGSSHGSVAVRVLGVPNVVNLEAPGTGRPLDSTANQYLANRGNLKVVFQNLRVLTNSVDPPLTLLNRQGDVFKEDGVHGELSLLGNETGSNTQSTDTGSVVVSDDPQLSLSGYLFNLPDEFALVPVEEVMEHNFGGKFPGKDRGRSEVPSNDDARTNREMPDEDLTGGKGLEFGNELLYAE